ncbi:flagellar biosynthetic protein FliR [Vibrio mediterranei]|uniref:flagellar biosynthetic protein FliR n=1 Tax=Vibrio mediterranei TaxID=689 RepID=UPI00406940EC
MEVSLEQIMIAMGALWWPFIRVCGFFLAAPIFGDRTVSVRYRIILALVFSTLLVPLQTTPTVVDPFKIETVFRTLTELFIGFCLGFTFNILFTIFSQAGQIVSMQMGLAMAVMNDPKNGSSVAIIARFFLISCTLIFLSIDGHVLMLSILKESTTIWPVGTVLTNIELGRFLHLFSWLFSQSVLLALPSVAIMLSSNITFGLLSKMAPSLNIFALGFPFTITMGLFALFCSSINLGDVLINASNDLNSFFNLQFG